MPKQNGPGGPYVIVPAPLPAPPPPPLVLYVPESVTDSATEEQLRRIAQIEVSFAHRVAVLLSETYSEIEAVLRTQQG